MEQTITIKTKQLFVAGIAVIAVMALIIAMVSRTGATGTPDQMLKSVNTFDNTADEADLTTTNSYTSGDPFNEVNVSANGAEIKVDDARSVAPGGKSLRISSGATAYAQYAGWTSTLLGSNPEMHASLYVWIDTRPSTSVRIMEFRGSGVRNGHIEITNAGKLKVIDNANASVTGTTTLTTGQWVRIDARLVAGTGTGTIEAKLFNTANATVATDTVTKSAASTLTTVSGVRFGSASAVANVPAFWIDNTRVRLDAYPGPYTAPVGGTVTSEDFEDGTLGHFNKSGNATNSAVSPITGSRSLSFDATTVTSWAEMTQAVHGTDKRYAYVSFKYRNDGTNPTVNQPVVNLRNTNSTLFSGGGHLNVWGDATTDTFKGDLMSTNNFDSGVAFNTGQTYWFEFLISYNADSTSNIRVKIDGTAVADVSSTTAANDLFRSVLLGSNSVNTTYLAKYDDLTVITSATPLDMF